MSNIPSKQDQQNANASQSASTAAAYRASQVKNLTDGLIAAINANTQKSVTLRGVFAPDVVAEVGAEFAKSGWKLTLINQARNQATFSLT